VKRYGEKQSDTPRARPRRRPVEGRYGRDDPEQYREREHDDRRERDREHIDPHAVEEPEEPRHNGASNGHAHNGYDPRNAAGKVKLLNLDSLDGRTRAAREAQILISELYADLGGVENLSGAQKALCQRAGVLAAMLADSEARFLSGQPVDLALHGNLCCRQRRVLETLGLSRAAKVVTPNRATQQVLNALMRSGRP